MTEFSPYPFTPLVIPPYPITNRNHPMSISAAAALAELRLAQDRLRLAQKRLDESEKADGFTWDYSVQRSSMPPALVQVASEVSNMLKTEQQYESGAWVAYKTGRVLAMLAKSHGIPLEHLLDAIK